ncbi:hypothetical protein L21_0112 [Methanoculleus chikugoensis]|uniref:Uncharacterized protein n=1 Tax=Methanoculleus chikugoensis TaxID=118126 RepID=A0A1M4MH63_9EURY|nr:hypothetical protein [Methanoculleus chikugoensis]SCL74244.1 hypothetical protein L21_0112 [Methanoculleus chikugoensis]
MIGKEMKSTGYFSFRELGMIALLAILAVFSGTYAPVYLLPGGSIAGFVHQFLILPGPGAGVFVFGSILCFWLVLGLLLVKKPGTAAVMSLLIVAIDLLIGTQAVSIHAIDVIVLVAVIIEILTMLPLTNTPLKYVTPALLAVLGATTLLLFLAGQAKMGENGAPATSFPLGYVVISLIALCYAVICYRHPAKYLAASAIANMYYLLHFWLFWGSSFAGRFPVAPDIIPVLLCVAAVGGVLSASGAYAIDLLVKMYSKADDGLVQGQ